MSSAEQDLILGETVTWRARVHWFVLFWPLVITVILGLFGLVFLLAVATPGGSVGGSLILGAIGLACLVTASAEAGFGYASWKSAEALLTDRRIVVRSGVFRTTALSIFLATVESATIQQGSVGKALDFGTLVIRLRGGAVKYLRRIWHPSSFQRCLQQTLPNHAEII